MCYFLKIKPWPKIPVYTISKPIKCENPRESWTLSGVSKIIFKSPKGRSPSANVPEQLVDMVMMAM